MRIQKIAKTYALSTKKQNVIKHKIFFKGDDFKKTEVEKLTFAKKKVMLAKLKDVGIKNYYKALSLPDSEFYRFVDFYENQEAKSEFAFKYSKLDKRQDGLFKYLREKSVSPQYALKATDYDNKQLKRYAKIFSEFSPEYMVDSAVKLGDKKFEKLVQLLDEGNGFVSSYDVVILEDEEYEKAIKLKEKGFNLIFADDVVKDKVTCEILEKAIEDGIDIRILNVAFKRTSKFTEIKNGVKKQKPEELLVRIALENASESILDYFSDNIKGAKETDFLVKNKIGKVSTHVIDKRGSKIQDF